MNKEELPVEEEDKNSIEELEEIIEESSVPLSQYEKIKDDHLRLAADFDNYKKRVEKEKEREKLVNQFMIGMPPSYATQHKFGVGSSSQSNVANPHAFVVAVGIFSLYAIAYTG